MKSLLLLTALMVSALPVKAVDDPQLLQKQAYFYGFVFGSGATLCGAIADKQITKEYAQYFLPELVREISKNPDSKELNFTLNKAQNDSIKSDTCKGVFE